MLGNLRGYVFFILGVSSLWELRSTLILPLLSFLFECFSVGPVRTVSIPNRNGKSLGYGFVEFHSPEDAKRAVEEMNNVVVDEYPLHLSLSQRKSAASDRASSSTPAKTSASSRGSTKIIARNIPFQATKRELRELFSFVFEFF